LYDESSSLVFGLAMRILGNSADAEEVSSDVYTQVWQHAATFDSRRGSPSAWLIMLTRSRAIDRIRSRDARRRSETPMEGIELTARSTGPESTLYLTWQRDLVQRALVQLSPEQHEVITLAFFSGFTQSELAEKLSLPLGTVKTRLRLALTKLRRALQEISTL
jgi:RNA polymerase sigma-70 factor (ECF subfamily)